MSHLTKRFEAALHALVTEGPIKQRLSKAYSDHLEDLQEADLPAGLRGTFHDLNEALHRVAPMGKETRIKASVQKMSFLEAGAHASTIVKLYTQLLRHGDRAEPLKVVKAAPAETVPHFLASN